jgi:uncharacterized protein YejL (UPF0352 family)
MSDESADKWDKITPTGRGKRGLSASGQGAGKKEKGEAQRLTRSEITQTRKTLAEMSPSQMVGMLGIRKDALTPKQRAYAYNVAMGATKADAYRKAYKQDAAPSTLRAQPYILAADERIAREIEAYRLAAEASKHRTPADLRALVIQTLVQQVIDPDCPPAIRTQAAKTLGQVTEVAAFTERKESIVHHSSDALRAKIMGELQQLMSGGKVVEGERIEQDAASLLSELALQRTTETATEPTDTDGSNPIEQDTDTPDAK